MHRVSYIYPFLPSILYSTKKIHELVVCLDMFEESLDGVTFAKHITEIFVGKADYNKDLGLGLRLSNWFVTTIDRTTTNKRAKDITTEDHRISPFSVCLFPH